MLCWRPPNHRWDCLGATMALVAPVLPGALQMVSQASPQPAQVVTALFLSLAM